MGHLGSLACGTVVIEPGARTTRVVVGTLMVEYVYAPYQAMQPRHIARVATIGIATRGLGRHGEPLVGHFYPIGRSPSGPVLDIVDITERYLIEVYHVAADVGERSFLAEKVAAARHAMVQGNGRNGKATVLVDHLRHGGVYGMKDDLELQSRAKGGHLHVKHGAQLFRCIDMQRGRPTQHTERGNHADEAKAMVAMKMGDKDTAYACEMDAGAAQLYLRALTAVDHKHLLAYLHHLRRGIVMERRQRAATAQYVYLKGFHYQLCYDIRLTARE